jgi:5-methylcytosine-specific restriction endonuclease McrA
MPYLPINVKKQDRKDYDKRNQSFYNSTAWRGTRAAMIRTSPLCVICLKKNTMTDCTKGGQVDHIIRIRAGGAKLDPLNLWVLCYDHHHKKSYLESRGYEVDKQIKESEYIPTAKGMQDLISKLIA